MRRPVAAFDPIAIKAATDVLEEVCRLRAGGRPPGDSATARERLLFLAASSTLEVERHDHGPR